MHEHRARCPAYNLIGNTAQQQPSQAAASVRLNSDQVAGIGLRLIENGACGVGVHYDASVDAHSASAEPFCHVVEVSLGARLQLLEKGQLQARWGIASQFHAQRLDGFDDPQQRVIGPRESPEVQRGLQNFFGLGRAVQWDQHMLEDGFSGQIRAPFMGPQQ
jgi:hypothetical protein